jgi:hypothetical protein
MPVSFFEQPNLGWFNWGRIPISFLTRMTVEHLSVDHGQREMPNMRDRKSQTHLQN